MNFLFSRFFQTKSRRSTVILENRSWSSIWNVVTKVWASVLPDTRTGTGWPFLSAALILTALPSRLAESRSATKYLRLVQKKHLKSVLLSKKKDLQHEQYFDSEWPRMNQFFILENVPQNRKIHIWDSFWVSKLLPRKGIRIFWSRTWTTFNFYFLLIMSCNFS